MKGRRRRWLGSTLTLRAVVVTCLVALISVAFTAAVALPLTLRTANEEARTALADKARVAANVIEGRDTPVANQRADQRARKTAQTLRDQGVETVLIRDGQADQAGLPPWLVKQIADGGSVSRRVLYQGSTMLAEGRPAGPGDGIVLLQTAAPTNVGAIIARTWLALAAGLLAGLLAGVLLARRLGHPLRQVAAAARRLSSGDRSARAPTDAPAEIADVSVALNELAAALAWSENRQRTFLMSVSHELRTPLTTIKGYAEALADGVVTADGTQRVGQTMLAESEHLGRLVEDLLVLARLEADDFPLEVMPVELGSLVANAAESWAVRAATVGPVLRTELPAHAVLVRTDPGRIRQVIDGLLENAVRVVPAGAVIVLAVRAESPRAGSPNPDHTTLALPVAGTLPPPARPERRVSASEPPSPGLNVTRATRPGPGTAASGHPYVVIEVRDGGPGFTEDDLAVVFDRGALYERYKGVRAVGSGLGLALAQRLVLRLGGTIEAGHAPEGGARFTVRLPV